MAIQTPWHPRLRLRILAPAVLVAVPALALLVSTSFDRRQQAELRVADDATRLVRLATLNEQRLIEGTRQLLIAVSQSRDVSEGNRDGCGAYLQQLVPQYGATYANLAVSDASGLVICRGVPGPTLSIADRSYYQQAVAERRFVVGEYQIGRTTGTASLPFAYPVVGADGAVRGLVFAMVDLERLNRGLIGADWPDDASLIITDRNQTIVARYPNWQAWIGKSLANDPGTIAIGSKPQGTLDVTEEGERQLFAFAKIMVPIDTGLTVRVAISTTRAMVSANRAMYESLTALGLVSLLVMIGVKTASERLIIQPIVQLTGASRRIAAGDLGARAASSTTIPELSELGQDFDDMAAALEEREAARLRAERERKDLEQQYYQAQKMDAVGRLAGGIAHDFNNMLTAIIGYCELLLEDPALTEAQCGDVREIQKAGRTAATLTRQLLAFSRREIIEPVALDVNSILAGMDKMLHRLIGENMRVESRLSGERSCVKADRGQLEQVILNLLVNARDAMPNGGRIVLETSNLLLRDGVTSSHLAAPPGRYVLLSVSDEGCGIREEILPYLFEPFFTTKGVGKGTGLGLATIYGIVKQSGGGICVKSRIDQGSVFEIYLPQSSEQPSEPPRSVFVERGPAPSATILVVEDDPGIRELAGRVLSKIGYVVLLASGGEEARGLCERHDGAIHLLLSDVVMPGMSGPKVAELLIGMRPSMKVLYMSGYTDDAILRHGVMAHDMPFLQKPFTPERLVNKILDVLGNA
jgi:signal transduction histidine kinase/CheY-like chemotaxis protein